MGRLASQRCHAGSGLSFSLADSLLIIETMLTIERCAKMRTSPILSRDQVYYTALKKFFRRKILTLLIECSRSNKNCHIYNQLKKNPTKKKEIFNLSN